MKALCLFLISVIGFGLFFLMMIKGWGLQIKQVWPMYIYYGWWTGSMIVREVIEKQEAKKKEDENG